VKIIRARAWDGCESEREVGLFTGDHAAIKEWICQESTYLEPRQIKLVEVEVKHIEQQDVERRRKVKEALDAAKKNAKEVGL
jgi:hypothetical protein